eukprot:CAMPEP_0194747672 /NCGR_PEP_ID=MMETSP0323_2-20130528/1824_1 /TAXON_ID=2866 ORGANISM="Crypthecodinium cohnii, Strain Seligo" /NCGR_SAMPLE_ID=MMETSP0323_2 /ASSEMBLY_ACC=CAM_ASM_000346 /LENGTH=166 /DNA_ID=CAMNT_0039661297 /DNA_START=79 /DNA_END=579 /DNA_ORIENTATION=-
MALSGVLRTLALCALAAVGILCILHQSGSDIAGTIGGRHLSAEDEVSSLAAESGKCSLRDKASMQRLGEGHGRGSFPETLSSCGKSAYSWFSFHESSMKSCLTRNMHISDECAQCFVGAGKYSFNNCKLQCLFGSWCSSSCLSCAQRYDPTVHQCAGVDVPKVTQC